MKIEFDLNGRIAEFGIDSFTARRHGSFEDPPEDAEIEIANEVWIKHPSGDEEMEEVVTWKTAVREFAARYHVGFDVAEEQLYNKLLNLAEKQFYDEEAKAEAEYGLAESEHFEDVEDDFETKRGDYLRDQQKDEPLFED